MYDFTRADWNARAPKARTPLAWRRVVWCILHWPAAGGRIGTDPATIGRWLRGWQTHHMDTKGWNDIAYTVGVDILGRSWELRGFDVTNGATEGLGGVSTAILAILGPGETPTPAMLATIRRWQAYTASKAPGPVRNTWHGYHGSTACPGPALTAWAKAGFPTTTDIQKDDTMAITDADARKIADALLDTLVPRAGFPEDSPYTGTTVTIRDLFAWSDAVHTITRTAVLAAVSQSTASILTAQGIDPAATRAAIADAVRDALEGITLTITPGA